MRKPTCFVHLVLALALTPTVAFAGDVRVRLVGLQSGEGDALAALFESAAAFSAEKRSQRVARLVEGNTAELVFADVAPGIYGVSAFQDMNANGMIDKNFLGIPKERYGFSNNARGSLGPPDFEAISFTVEGDSVVLEIKLR